MTQFELSRFKYLPSKNWFLKILFGAIGIVFSLFLLSLYSRYNIEPTTQDHSSQAFDNRCPSDINRQPDIETLAALQERYGKGKVIPEQYRTSILSALSRYPELIDTQINFVVRETFTPIESRPHISTIFNPFEQRQYQVIINPKVALGMQAALFDRLSFEGKVGAIGHELGHTLYYKNKSSWELIQVGLAYLWSDFRKQFERGADLAAIHHCLGIYLLTWSQELRPGGDSQWASYGGYYLSPVEIQSFIDNK